MFVIEFEEYAYKWILWNNNNEVIIQGVEVDNS